MTYIHLQSKMYVITRKIIGLYYSGRQSQQSFLLSPSTHSLPVMQDHGYLLDCLIFGNSKTVFGNLMYNLIPTLISPF
jgi:hypothetical protein